MTEQPDSFTIWWEYLEGTIPTITIAGPKLTFAVKLTTYMVVTDILHICMMKVYVSKSSTAKT